MRRLLLALLLSAVRDLVADRSRRRDARSSAQAAPSRPPRRRRRAAARRHHARSSPSTAPAATTPGSRCGPARDGGWQQRMQADRRPDRVRRPGGRPAAPAGHRHDPARAPTTCPGRSAPTAATRPGTSATARSGAATSGCRTTRSDFYNRYRNKRQGGFRWWLPSSDPNSSERLTDYPTQYEWSIVIELQPRARCGTAAPGSSCTSTARARPPAA